MMQNLQSFRKLDNFFPETAILFRGIKALKENQSSEFEAPLPCLGRVHASRPVANRYKNNSATCASQ